MTNIYGRPAKVSMKGRLFKLGVEALEREGWRVERLQGSGKSSVRKVTRGKERKVVSIRTTQDTWIAFPRNGEDTGWQTLDEVDMVVAVSVNDPQDPKFASVHVIDGDEMRERFNRAYAARVEADYRFTVGRGMWVSLYAEERQVPVTYVGAGAGLKNPPIATIRLESTAEAESIVTPSIPSSGAEQPPLTIAEAKRRLAITLGVDPSSIKITVEA